MKTYVNTKTCVQRFIEIHQLMNVQINCSMSIPWNIIWHYKGMKYWYHATTWMKLKNTILNEKGRNQRLQIVWVHWYEMFRKCKCRAADSRLLTGCLWLRKRRLGGNSEWLLMVSFRKNRNILKLIMALVAQLY